MEKPTAVDGEHAVTVSQREHAQKVKTEKDILLDVRRHRVEESEAIFLRYAAIVVSWISGIVSLILAIAAIWFAAVHGSQSLFGFGLDSLLDSVSSSIILWRFHGQDIYSQLKEARACIMIGSLFILSSILLAGKSIEALVVANHTMAPGAAVLLASINAVLCAISGTCKLIIGFKLESKAIMIDSVITYTGAVMSVYTLIFSAIYQEDKSVWYLDDVFGILCSLFLLGYGIRVLFTSVGDLKTSNKNDSIQS